MSYFLFAGKSCKDYGLTVEEYPSYITGQRRVETQDVPGKNGQLVFDTKSFGNGNASYPVYVNATDSNLMEAGRKIGTWMLGAFGYQRLEDDYDVDVYRMAVYSGPLDFDNFFNRYGRATITFSCMPQRWLKSGTVLQNLTNGQTLQNDWMEAKPLIIVSGNGSGILRFNDYQVSISSIPTSGITLDSDTEDAYQGADNLNSLIKVSNEGFPRLDPGETTVEWSGGIDSVSIYTRWWAP